jgi:hypothetical protein
MGEQLSPELRDGWIEWAGGPCPITDQEAEFGMELRSGLTLTGVRAAEWNWENRGHSLDIVKYRVEQFK